MKKIFQEIHEQPEHIREIFMWLFVVITFSVVGLAWAKSTEKKFVALVNPDQVIQERVVAKSSMTSPLATIFGSIGDLKASLFEILSISSSSTTIQNSHAVYFEQVEAKELPLSENK